MTVREFIEEMKKFDGDAEVRGATSPSSDLEIASIYEDEGVVWLDLEPRR